MSRIVDNIISEYLVNNYSKEIIDKQNNSIREIADFCKNIGIDDDSIRLEIPSIFKTGSDINSINYGTLQMVLEYCETLAREVEMCDAEGVANARLCYIFDIVDEDLEDIVDLRLIDNAAANMVKKYNNYHSFLKDLNCELFELLDKKMGRNKNRTNHNEQLALILRLSWEMSYIKKVADSVKECEYSSDSSSTEKRYKDREKKKIIKEFKASGVQGEWINDISLLAAHTDSNGLCHEAMMIVDQVQVKYKWLFDCIESSSY